MLTSIELKKFSSIDDHIPDEKGLCSEMSKGAISLPNQTGLPWARTIWAEISKMAWLDKYQSQFQSALSLESVIMIFCNWHAPSVGECCIPVVSWQSVSVVALTAGVAVRAIGLSMIRTTPASL